MKPVNKIVIKKSSEKVKQLMDSLRNRKVSQLQELRKQESCTFTISTFDI